MREIAQDFKTDLRFQSLAVLALQEVRSPDPSNAVGSVQRYFVVIAAGCLSPLPPHHHLQDSVRWFSALP